MVGAAGSQKQELTALRIDAHPPSHPDNASDWLGTAAQLRVQPVDTEEAAGSIADRSRSGEIEGDASARCSSSLAWMPGTCSQALQQAHSSLKLPASTLHPDMISMRFGAMHTLTTPVKREARDAGA